MKKIIVGTIIGLVIAVTAFISGARYGAEEVGKIYGEALCTSIGSLDVGEQSTEYTLCTDEDGEEYSKYNGIKYVVIRTK